ncbi:hypothetical protein SAMN05444408_11541 [Chryseobacterium takakiae]|uniref:Uncharacterized protein n=1 Tax=Chryseobacterium takakiae TaxID=1302685 RepID=A0A1M5AUU9_9FLAO|nr:hypothetical protein SAMN05444408_11541 [Chryseobacterium takakiae]
MKILKNLRKIYVFKEFQTTLALIGTLATLILPFIV